MTPAQRIRKAALGATPEIDPGAVMEWLGGEPLDIVRGFCHPTQLGGYDFRHGSDTERRMFLLFVAEALENECLSAIAAERARADALEEALERLLAHPSDESENATWTDDGQYFLTPLQHAERSARALLKPKGAA